MFKNQEEEERWGYSPLHDAVSKGDHERVLLLLRSGADVNAMLKINGYTPLHSAVLDWTDNGHAIVDLLLTHGASANGVNLGGETPIFLAANPQIVEKLISAGANVNHRAESGLTPLLRLFQTTRGRHTLEKISMLVKAGANINTRVGEISCLTLARTHNRPDAEELLTSLGAQ